MLLWKQMHFGTGFDNILTGDIFKTWASLGSVVKSPPVNWPLAWEDPWRRKWQPTPLFLPGQSHGQRSLAGYSTGVGYKRVGYNFVAEQKQKDYLKLRYLRQSSNKQKLKEKEIKEILLYTTCKSLVGLQTGKEWSFELYISMDSAPVDFWVGGSQSKAT